MRIFDFWFKNKLNMANANNQPHNNSDKSSEVLREVQEDEPKQLNYSEERIKFFYEHPETLVDIEFSNRTNIFINIWVEPLCLSIDLDKDTEYKVVSHDRFFRIEFDKDNQIVFYLQHSFGFKLYKRASSADILNENEWLLDYDCSDIN
ncbi:hypothetical protein [Hymenobacter sp. IS2118]|uniref:hypothetical protein n=1 Tax=Hymenobacter sp. IS2118 TaxID=1505605 RepID=UPI0012687659|nr:hypothetical protein [Hymenobacter sp. IS2118]